MRIRYLRISVVCLLLVSIFALGAFGGIAENVMPRFAYIGSISAGICLSGNDIVYDGVGEASSNSHIAGITVKLQRRPIDGGSWTSITSHTARGSYAIPATYEGRYSVNMNYKYRTYVKCTIYDSDGNTLETSTMYSHVLDPRTAN